MRVNSNSELVPWEEADFERLETNKKENRPLNFMGEAKLYVGNISFQCTESDLEEAFSEFGTVGQVSVALDPEGNARGFAFVTMRTKEEGEACLENLNGAEVGGRNIAVREATN